MSDPASDVDLPEPPRDPTNFLGIGVVLAVVGGSITVLSEEAAGLGILVGSIGGLVFFIGAVGQGVLMALRRNRYEIDLQRIIDGPDERR